MRGRSALYRPWEGVREREREREERGAACLGSGFLLGTPSPWLVKGRVGRLGGREEGRGETTHPQHRLLHPALRDEAITRQVLDQRLVRCARGSPRHFSPIVWTGGAGALEGMIRSPVMMTVIRCYSNLQPQVSDTLWRHGKDPVGGGKRGGRRLEGRGRSSAIGATTNPGSWGDRLLGNRRGVWEHNWGEVVKKAGNYYSNSRYRLRKRWIKTRNIGRTGYAAGTWIYE